LVAASVAHALGVAETSGSLTDAIVDGVDGASTLLVLDNFEHVVQAAPFVSDLLRRAPAANALVTSRSILGLCGENEYPLPPLELPSTSRPLDPATLARTEAVGLFLARAPRGPISS
jgi:non-specific serine/threonine protein kinase